MQIEKEVREVMFPMSEKSKELFHLKTVDVNSYSPLALAFMGDNVYELVIRTLVLNQSNTNVNKLNQKTSHLAKAGTQARMVQFLLDSDYLTENEAAVYRRGRNAKSSTMAKNATISEYRMATGLEALLGWLYLSGEHVRILEVMRQGLEYLHREEENGTTL